MKTKTITEGLKLTRVTYGLEHIQGNSQPHFSATCDEFMGGRHDTGGCQHERVLRLWPELADVVALHLSDLDGAPMHAEANGFYWLTGIVGGMGDKYHPGNGTPAHSATDCIRILSEHARIPQAHVVTLAGRINTVYKAEGITAARALFKKWTDAQRPRWKAEALACIRKHELGVHGFKACTHDELIAQIEGATA